mgnify:CR=1 FL=1
MYLHLAVPRIFQIKDVLHADDQAAMLAFQRKRIVLHREGGIREMADRGKQISAVDYRNYVQEEMITRRDSAKKQRGMGCLTDAQKELVEGENADPDYFGRDTGDASKDDPLNGDEIGENELLVVSLVLPSTTAVLRISEALRKLCRLHIRTGP